MTTTQANSPRNSLAVDLREALGPGYQVPTITRSVETHFNHLSQSTPPTQVIDEAASGTSVGTFVLRRVRVIVESLRGCHSGLAAPGTSSSMVSASTESVAPGGCCPA